VSLLIDTNRSSGPASPAAWLKVLKGPGVIIPISACPPAIGKSKTSGKPYT
jgi:hypothetical protein